MLGPCLRGDSNHNYLRLAPGLRDYLPVLSLVPLAFRGASFFIFTLLCRLISLRHTLASLSRGSSQKSSL